MNPVRLTLCWVRSGRVSSNREGRGHSCPPPPPHTPSLDTGWPRVKTEIDTASRVTSPTNHWPQLTSSPMAVLGGGGVPGDKQIDWYIRRDRHVNQTCLTSCLVLCWHRHEHKKLLIDIAGFTVMRCIKKQRWGADGRIRNILVYRHHNHTLLQVSPIKPISS